MGNLVGRRTRRQVCRRDRLRPCLTLLTAALLSLPLVVPASAQQETRDDEQVGNEAEEHRWLTIASSGPIDGVKSRLSDITAPRAEVVPVGICAGATAVKSPFVGKGLPTLIAEAQTLSEDAPAYVMNTEQGLAFQKYLESALRLQEGNAAISPNEVEIREELALAHRRLEAKTKDYDSLVEEIESIGQDGRVAVRVEDLTTGLPLVSVRASDQFTAASTYKVYVASSMIDEVEKGNWKWSDPFLGTTLGECFDIMIVESDNDCPNEWIGEIGWEPMADTLKKLKTKNTEFAPYDIKTTASDLSRALMILDDPGSMSRESRERLFEDMETQEYRDGIPAALDSVGTVADKVGFLEVELHDAAIVRTPKGDYTMVILTEDLSWEAIEQITEAIYDYL